MDYKIENIEEDGLVYEVRIYLSGDKYWYYNDKLHRLNGPAVEHADGDKYYYINNNLHRLNGPAIERTNGTKYYYINGQYFNTFEEYKEAVIQYKIKEILSNNN